jgi:hypothetical protein
MSENVQDVTDRAKLIGCVVIWSLFLGLAVATIFWLPGNRTFLAITAVSILILSAAWDFYLRWRDYRALSARVRSELRTERCHRCGGSLEAWDGRFWPLRMCVTYSRPAMGEEFRWLRHKLVVKCFACSRSIQILVWSDGKLTPFEKFLGIDLEA